MDDAAAQSVSVDDRARLQAMLSVSPVAVGFLDRDLRYARDYAGARTQQPVMQ